MKTSRKKSSTCKACLWSYIIKTSCCC